MAASTKKFLVLAIVLVVMATAPGGEAQISCGTVVSKLNPCIPYVTKNEPLGNCCKGVKALNSAATTTPDRQSVCRCLKSLAASYGAYIGKAASLPGVCNVNIGYSISPSTDCSKVV